jgi:hypothetical protein
METRATHEPLEAYLASDAISSSDLRTAERSLSDYRTRRKDPTTHSQRLGSALHIAILEPHLLDECVVVPPTDVLAKNGARSGNAYKEWLAGVPLEIHVVSQSERDRIARQCDSVRNNPACVDILGELERTEHSIYFTDDLTRADMRSRLDGYSTLSRIVVDVKTTAKVGGYTAVRHANGAPDLAAEFWRALCDYGYHCQAALQCDAFLAFTDTTVMLYAYLLVGSEPPYPAAVRYLPASAIAIGHERNARALAAIDQAERAGEWSSTSLSNPHTLFIPEYADLG